MILADTHCHLDFEKFNPDLDSVLERAVLSGVDRMLIPGLSMDSSISAVQMAEHNPLLYAAVGIHPTEAATFSPASLTDLHKIAQNPRVKAIGEVGLDYFWDISTQSLQQEVLNQHLILASHLQLPVIIHFRERKGSLLGECARDLLKILQQWLAEMEKEKNPLRKKPGVLHSFSGSLEMAREVMHLGFYLGISGSITYPSNHQLRDVVGEIPLEHILLETDAPFQTPLPHRGERNEPAYIRLIADKIALVRSCTTDQVAAITCENARQLFSWE